MSAFKIQILTVSRIISFFLSFLIVMPVIATGHYAKVTEVNITINKNGEIQQENQVLLLDGHEAVLTFFKNGTNHPLSRILIKGSKEGKSSLNELIKLEISYQTYLNKAWKTEANSTIINNSNKEGKLSFISDEESLDITTLSTSRDGEILLSDPLVLSALECNNTPADADVTPHARQKCCSKSCSDGSARTMKCCGALSCCGCGACCSTNDSR